MQKLPIKEEIMAVAALLALGMLAVLATNGNATYGQTNVVYGQTSKAWFAACMWVNDWKFNNSEIVYGCVRDALGLGFGGGAFIGSTIYLLTGVARAALIGGLVGFAVITA
jgi:hypothetical protein